MPPSTAIAIAIRSSVTVSIAALTTGVLSTMCRENRLLTLASPGRISEYCGMSSTSSKVNPRSGCVRNAPATSADPAGPNLVVMSPPSSSLAQSTPPAPRLQIRR